MNLQAEVPLEVLSNKRNKNDDTTADGEECVRERSGVEASEASRSSSQGRVVEGQRRRVGGDRECIVTMEPPDGGWGWVVAFASAVSLALVPTVSLCFGVLFSRYLLLAGVSSTTTAWIFNLQNFLYDITALFVRPLSQEFGWRKVGVTGALLASLGFTITSFTPSPEFLFFSFSVICGVGTGSLTTLCYIVVPNYFTRRRGLAMAIMGCGMGIGHIAVPPLITLLQETFADRGATLVYSGLMLHSCIAATAFHPVERHMKPCPVTSTETHSHDETKPESKPPISNSTSSPKPSILVRVTKSVTSDVLILGSRRACIICVSWALTICSTINFLMLLPFAIQDAGFTLEFSAWCLSSLGVSSLIVRILTSALSDLPFFKVKSFFVAGLVVLTATSAVFPLAESQELMILVTVGLGVGTGTIAGLFTLVVIDVMGLDRLATVIGTSSLMCALSLLTLGPFIGVIRDVSGSYPVCIWFMSGMFGCSVLLWAMMGQATKWDTERREEGRPDL